MTGSRIACPAKGEPPRVAWAAQVTEACNAMMAVGGAGTLVREGPQGRGFAPLPANLRDRGGASGAETAGCFQISTNQSGVYSFSNRYYMLGNVLKSDVADRTVDELAAAAGSTTGNFDVFVCLNVPMSGSSGTTASLVAHVGAEALNAAQLVEDVAVVPLYLLSVRVESDGADESGPAISWSVECDFRKVPFVQTWEDEL